MSLIDSHLIELLICPLCQGELSSEEATAQLRCHSCGRAFPVRAFPIMMPEIVPDKEGVETSSPNATD